MNTSIIEKLIIGKRVTQKELEEELYEICDREHSHCNEACPVYRLNNGTVGVGGCNCFKSGHAMYVFIAEQLLN